MGDLIHSGKVNGETVIDILLDLCEIIKKIGSTLYDILFYQFNIFGNVFTVWQMLLTGGAVVLIALIIISFIT